MVGRLLRKPVTLSAGAVVIVAGAGVLAWLFLWRMSGPVVDKDLERAILPAGYAEFKRQQKVSRHDAANLRIEAKRTFGLPPDAPVATR